ncbi:MAG: hypothetical protein GY906_40130 [bacterium]|nr:hypothetical protein [bacterium]
MKNALFTAVVTIAFGLGMSSLLLAVATPPGDSNGSAAGRVRTALANQIEKIDIVIGDPEEKGIVYAVVNVFEIGDDPRVVEAARGAAHSLGESGLDASVRLLGPGDPDFAQIVEQNDIVRFPAVLVAKKGAGIVLVSDEITEESLAGAYWQVLGRSSSCVGAMAGVG